MSEQGSTEQHHPGTVIWITGLAGAGKSSVAAALRTKCGASAMPPILLDGDRLREVMGATASYEPAERRALAARYARLCQELARQGFSVICATISMFHEIHAWNRANMPRYFEVYLRVPRDELTRRNQKGLYMKTTQAPSGPVAGLDYAVEEPLTPDLIIDNFGGTTAQVAADAIYSALHSQRLAT